MLGGCLDLWKRHWTISKFCECLPWVPCVTRPINNLCYARELVRGFA